MSPTALTLIISAFIPVIQNFMKWLAEAKKASQQTRAWTAEETAANQAAIDKLGLNPEVWEQVQPL